MSALANAGWSDFSVVEWNRLSRIADKYEPKMKTAYVRTVARGNQANSLEVRNIVSSCIIETAMTSADTYDMVFNPNSPVYRTLIDELTDGYTKVVGNDSAKEKVKEILPAGLSLSQRRSRLDVFGLDERGAVRIERMRQDGSSESTIRAARFDLSVQRGNLISLTEINRIINRGLETLWTDNIETVSKIAIPVDSNVWRLDDSIVQGLNSVKSLNRRVRKTIVTRRDNRICKYCEPLDGLKAKLNTEFKTFYGYFLSPPFHPRCRCFLTLGLS